MNVILSYYLYSIQINLVESIYLGHVGDDKTSETIRDMLNSSGPKIVRNEI